MPDAPPYSALARVDRAVIYGLMERRGRGVLDREFEFAWERDRALRKAVDDALDDAVRRVRLRKVDPAGKPRWLDGLVRRDLAQASRTSWASGFGRVRLLERTELVTLEPDDTYVLAMISAIGPEKEATLRADPDLVERALWRVFEVEGGGEVSLANVDRFGGDQWRTAFLTLTADGTLPRGRVLTGCLEALRRDFAAYRAAWFTATFLALEPTDDEVAARQDELRGVLGASVPATVAFAVRLLVHLQKAGRCDVDETLAALPGAALVRTKGTALDVLRLARALGSDRPDALAAVATAALGHPHADVQRAAADALSGLGDEASVAASADTLDVSVRHDLGLDVVEATAGPGEQPLAPAPGVVADADVVERVAVLLEDCSDPGELEAVLAALAGSFDASRLAPLARRARAVVARDVAQLGGEGVRGHVAALVLRLLGEPVDPHVPATPVQRFLVHRLGEVGEGDGPLLATPDLPGSRVSPEALLERLARTRRARHHDVVAALLRLQVDGAGVPTPLLEALDSASSTPGLPRGWQVALRRTSSPYAADEAPRLHSEVLVHTWDDRGTERRSTYLRCVITTDRSGTQPDDEPTEIVKPRPADPLVDLSPSPQGDWVGAVAAVWPYDAEHVLSLTAVPVLEAPNYAEVAHDVPRVLDALARHPGHMGTLATHTLAAGLSSAKREHRLHAVDAFLDLVPTGRIPCVDMAEVLARYVAAWPVTRWAESLTAAAQGPGGSATVVALLTALLPRLPVETRGLHALLELLRDEHLRLGSGVTDPALTAWLAQHTGSSRKARLARLLSR